MFIYEMKRTLLTMAVAIATAITVEAQTARQFILTNSSDGQSELHCFLPQHPNGRAVIACPGGAYGGLSFEKEGTQWAEWFNAQGIAYFTLKYRLPNGRPELPLGDAYQAIRTVRDSAAVWHINRRDVGIMGFSAGGHLAATVSTHAPFDALPDFSILVYPVITMGKGTHEGTWRRFLGEKKESEALIKEYSNELKVNHYSTPPAILLLSNDDRTVPPVQNAVAYYSAMRKAGNPCTMHIYPDGGHGWGFASWFKHHDQMLGDLMRWLQQLKAPQEDAIRVACIGNSITRGSCIDMASQLGYPAQLQKMLGPGFNVHNFGMAGYTMLSKGDYPYVKSGAWKMAQAFDPNIVIIKLGTNDSKAHNWKYGKEFEGDLQAMIDTLRALPSKPRIILAHPIRIFHEHHGMSDSVLIHAVNPTIDKVAKRNKLEVLDLRQAITDEKMLVSDGIHPNHNGAKLIARMVADAILAPVTVQKATAKK